MKRASCEEMVYCSQARSAHEHFLWPGFLALFGLAGTVSTPLLDVTVTARFHLTVCAMNSTKAVLVLPTFCLPHTMQRSECCEVSSECVVLVTVQHTLVQNCVVDQKSNTFL